jgi:hypothetical protein
VNKVDLPLHEKSQFGCIMGGAGGASGKVDGDDYGLHKMLFFIKLGSLRTLVYDHGGPAG